MPAYPYHTEMSVVFSQALWIISLCISGKDFEKHREEIKLWFRKRKYPEDLISSEMGKVMFSNLKLKSNDKNHNMKGITLAVTYHPLLKSLSALIDKNVSILCMDKEVKRVITLRCMVSFRSAHKLNNYLVKAKLYPSKRMVGSNNCKSKRC